MKKTIAGIDLPDSAMAQDATMLIRGMESESMLHHSIRSFLFGALTGQRERTAFDADLLYVGALFHNVGLHPQYRHSPNRFEVDSANAARDFLSRYNVPDVATREVWEAIALHTTPGISEHMPALVALMSAGVQMDVRGARYDDFTAHQRDEIVQAYPRERGFKEALIESYALGMQSRPETTFGTVNADVLDRWDPNYLRMNFCGLVLGSAWPT
ncbi:HD domain-containing protein [Paraburkholderia sp.]|uniref:HD domain-containing protein n=1 Tax=Paraburkholderia sp. TaxID=1926495 RepID=UPI00238DD0EC|nr:HD domain-containing protein [Paraburkholderia sp.]MDE1179887.1 HD domain-containing protein [Paraburkholderia sp.]